MQDSLGKIVTITLCILVFILNMDITVVNVALPALGMLPGATDDKLQWIVAAYALSAAVAVIPSGALLDRYGPRRVLAFSTLLFGTASLLAALSSSAMAVIISRVIMGLGSSAILTGSIATLTLYYQDRRKARAFGIWSACAAVGLSAGPLVGSWLLSVANWKSIFLINVPLSLFAVVAVIRAVPASNSINKNKIDFLSISALSLALLTGTAGLIEFGAGRVTSAIALAVLCLASLLFFMARQRGAGPRLLDWETLRSGAMLVPLFVLVVLFTVMSILLFLLPASFELSTETGSSASLYILPLPLGIAVAAVLGGYALNKLSPNMIMGISLGTIAIGLLAVIPLDPSRPSLLVLSGLACVGLGVGIGQPVALQTAVGAFSPGRRGVGSGFVNSLRLAANALGAGIAGGTVSLMVSGASNSAGEKSLTEGALSCRIIDATGKALEADLCLAYTQGLKLVLALALVAVIAAAIAVVTWKRISQTNHTAVTKTTIK